MSGRINGVSVTVRPDQWQTRSCSLVCEMGTMTYPSGVLGDLRGWTSALAWCVTNARGMIAGSVTIISCHQDTGCIPSDQKGKFRFSDAIGLDSTKPPNC